MANSNKRHLNASHDDNMTISNTVSGKEWKVVSGSNSYTVSNSVAYSTTHNCKCKCSLCNACLHIYSCSCLDYIVKANLCKHIHKVCIENNKIAILHDITENTGSCSNDDSEVNIIIIY
ncbi:hypothetical protein RI129_006842 [Pyrocoelia pectoralis]|uniref:SWIM-type domain-containing protein n=1 Tax=Pyrocoelia pectoralis TaxID=417401 RepID=A0AAN7ZIV9_9COLE